MKVSGILETALSVGDLAASAAFYKRLFGFATLLPLPVLRSTMSLGGTGC